MQRGAGLSFNTTVQLAAMLGDSKPENVKPVNNASCDAVVFNASVVMPGCPRDTCAFPLLVDMQSAGSM